MELNIVSEYPFFPASREIGKTGKSSEKTFFRKSCG